MIRERLSGARNRLLSGELLELTQKGDGPLPPDRYRATIHDYANNRALLAGGRLDDIWGSMEGSETSRQPLPNEEKFD